MIEARIRPNANHLKNYAKMFLIIGLFVLTVAATCVNPSAYAVVPNANEYKERVHALLSEEGIEVRSIEWIAPTLEDVFIRLTGHRFEGDGA